MIAAIAKSIFLGLPFRFLDDRSPRRTLPLHHVSDVAIEGFVATVGEGAVQNGRLEALPGRVMRSGDCGKSMTGNPSRANACIVRSQR